MRKISIFYKKLLEPGGAERLLAKVYENLKSEGYIVEIVGYQLKREALFSSKVKDNELIEFGSKYYLVNVVRLICYMSRNRDAIFLCDSGHIDIYIASIFSRTNYSLHLHHPLFMSFNDYDKYSLFLKRFFNKRIYSNFGASRFVEIQRGLSFKSKIFLNIRAIFSILAIKKALNIYVLSEYAKTEKKELFGVKSEVLCGAIDNDILNIKVDDIDAKYDKYDALILTVGRLDINKRHYELIKAFKILKDQGLNAALLIGGMGPEYNKLLTLVANLDLHDDVYFLGFIADRDLYRFYRGADLFVSIDWADYRITSFEAWAMGTKVILSDETDTDEYLINSNYLYTTPPTIEDTAKCIRRALKEEPKISKQDLHRYLKYFTWENYTKNLLKTLDKNG